MEEKSIMDYETLALDDAENALVIIDQTKLPGRTELLHLKTQKEIWVAINTLQVRGAPAIGDAAAIGIYLAAREIATEDMIPSVGNLPGQRNIWIRPVLRQ